MDRKYFETPVDELEAVFRENLRNRQVLGEIRDELTYRSSRRAQQLWREIEGLLRGDVKPPPEPPGPDGPEKQLDLLGEGAEE